MSFGTPSDIIKSALRLCGVIGKSEVPSADEMQDGLQALNLMLEQWSARRLIVRATQEAFFPLVAGQASYTIGPSLAFNFVNPKPITITAAQVVDMNGISTNLDIITKEEYDSYGDRFITTSRPIALCYDPIMAQQLAPMGNVIFYYAPDTTPYVVNLVMQLALTDFTALTDSVTFEPKYGEALKYELAKRLWREYRESDKSIPGDILVLADKAMCVLEKTNHQLPRAVMEIPPRRSTFNVYTGDFS